MNNIQVNVHDQWSIQNWCSHCMVGFATALLTATFKVFLLLGTRFSHPAAVYVQFSSDDQYETFYHAS